MKTCVLLAILGSLTLTLTGCGPGMAVSQRERQERWKRSMEADFRQFNDDFDRFWFMDEPSPLTEWEVR